MSNSARAVARAPRASPRRRRGPRRRDGGRAARVADAGRDARGGVARSTCETAVAALRRRCPRPPRARRPRPPRARGGARARHVARRGRGRAATPSRRGRRPRPRHRPRRRPRRTSCQSRYQATKSALRIARRRRHRRQAAPRAPPPLAASRHRQQPPRPRARRAARGRRARRGRHRSRAWPARARASRRSSSRAASTQPSPRASTASKTAAAPVCARGGRARARVFDELSELRAGLTEPRRAAAGAAPAPGAGRRRDHAQRVGRGAPGRSSGPTAAAAARRRRRRRLASSASSASRRARDAVRRRLVLVSSSSGKSVSVPSNSDCMSVVSSFCAHGRRWRARAEQAESLLGRRGGRFGAAAHLDRVVPYVMGWRLHSDTFGGKALHRGVPGGHGGCSEIRIRSQTVSVPTTMTKETPASVPTTPPSSWQEQGGYAACALAILGVGGVAGYHRQRRLEQEELENAARSKKRPRKVGGSGRRAPVPVPSAAAFSPSSHAARALAIGTALCGAGALSSPARSPARRRLVAARVWRRARDRIGPRVRAALCPPRSGRSRPEGPACDAHP